MTLPRLPFARVAIPLLAASIGLGSAGCAAGSPGPGAGSGALAAVASFYPLQLATAEIGGAHVSVLDLTKPGAEPHDLELTPRDVGAVEQGAPSWSTRRACSRPSTRRSTRRRRTAPSTSPPPQTST